MIVSKKERPDRQPSFYPWQPGDKAHWGKGGLRFRCVEVQVTVGSQEDMEF